MSHSPSTEIRATVMTSSTNPPIPMITVFNPPASCSSAWTYEAEIYNQVPSGLLIQNALPNFPDVNCFPAGFTQNGRVPGNINQVFSPGACPSGYTTAAINVVNNGVTTATCCHSYVSRRCKSLSGMLSLTNVETTLTTRQSVPM